MVPVRKTYRLSKTQHERLLALRRALSGRAGHRVSWQHVISSAVEAGLGVLGYPADADGAVRGYDDHQG